MNSSIYLDTNAVIEAVESPPMGILAQIGRLRARGTRVITSDLSMAELLVKPLKDGRDDLVRFYERLIGPSALIIAVPVDRDVLRRSAELRAGVGGKLPDSIHVATAVLTSCETIVSSDKRLRMPGSLRRILPDDLGEFLIP